MDGRVAQRIRELIVEGALPPGSRLAEATIAERLGVSRTPVRNALPALASEGLLEPAGKRGYAVRKFTLEDSCRATEIRSLLEGYAARQLALRADRGAVVAALREVVENADASFATGILSEDDVEDYAELNGRFHELIIGGAQDPLLNELIQRVYSVPFVAPNVVASKRIPLDEIYRILLSGHRHHHAILEAIEAGQADVAEMLMRAHAPRARRTLGLEDVARGQPA